MAKTTPAKAPAATAPAFTIEVGQGGAPVDEGAYPARIAAVLDLGIQAPPPGGKGAPRRQLAVGFELHGATTLDVEPEAPPVMFRRYGLSWGPKAELPKLLRALLGRDAAPGETLAPAEWIGKPVTVTVEHTARADGGTSARIASVTRCVAKGLPELAAAPLVYPGAALVALPEWAQEAIAGALHASTATAAAAAGYDADVPQ
jgi:hypothetical protein